MIVTQGPILAFGDWLREPGGASPATSFPTLDEAERAHIVKALQQCGWRVSGEQGAAEILGVPATTLNYRMKRLGIPPLLNIRQPSPISAKAHLAGREASLIRALCYFRHREKTTEYTAT